MMSASENAAPYRDPSSRYQDVWDWDVIVYPDGSVRVICTSVDCAYHCAHACSCAERSRMSSPVVDEYNHPLKETPYDGVLTGAARHLLGVSAGSKIPVLSGKSYRLVGSRVTHEGWGGGSIWEIYAKEEPEEDPPGLFQRMMDWLWQ